jgi:hypothetical protein
MRLLRDLRKVFLSGPEFAVGASIMHLGDNSLQNPSGLDSAIKGSPSSSPARSELHDSPTKSLLLYWLTMTAV